MGSLSDITLNTAISMTKMMDTRAHVLSINATNTAGRYSHLVSQFITLLNFSNLIVFQIIVFIEINSENRKKSRPHPADL